MSDIGRPLVIRHSISDQKSCYVGQIASLLRASYVRRFMCRLELGEPAMSAGGPPVSTRGHLVSIRGLLY